MNRWVVNVIYYNRVHVVDNDNINRVRLYNLYFHFVAFVVVVVVVVVFVDVVVTMNL